MMGHLGQLEGQIKFNELHWVEWFITDQDQLELILIVGAQCECMQFSIILTSVVYKQIVK